MTTIAKYYNQVRINSIGFQIDAFKMALSANQIEAEQILAQSEL